MRDSEDIVRGKGYGFRREDGRTAMIRCFECGEDNNPAYVMSGVCNWCGHDANPNKEGE